MASDENEYNTADHLAEARAKLADYQRRHRNNKITVESLAYFFMLRDGIKSNYRAGGRPEPVIEPYFDSKGNLSRLQTGAETGDTSDENNSADSSDGETKGGHLALGVPFNTHMTKLRGLLKTGTRQDANGKNKSTYAKGVYVFSIGRGDTTHKYGVAYGEGGLYERLKSYRTCYPEPDKIVIKYLIICPTVPKSKALEKMFLSHKRLPKKPNQYSNEWVIGKSAQLMNEVTIDILNRSDDWDKVAVLWEDGAEIHPKLIRRKKSDVLKVNDLERKPSSIRRAQSLT